MGMQFLKKIKTRIALSFSLLFLAVAMPAIIYAFHQVNLFFEGLYLQQMEVAGLIANSFWQSAPNTDYDSLAARISVITASTVFFIAPGGQILSRHYEDPVADTDKVLSTSIPAGDSSRAGVAHRIVKFGGRRYLQVQTELEGGSKLLQVKSFSRVSDIMAKMRQIIFWSSFLILIALIAVAFYVSANITRPLEELTVVAQRIRSGELPSKTDIRSPDEIGDMAQALNEIIESLSISRDRLQKLESIRSEFFANVREKLEEPLTGIQSLVENAIAAARFEETVDIERLEQALAKATKIRRTIRNLVEISALEFGEISLKSERVPIKVLMQLAADEFMETISRKGLIFDFQMDTELDSAQALGDRRLLHIVLENLLANAIDFTNEGFIRLACSEDEGKIKITVEDSGPGIPLDRLDRIFERLYSIGNGEDDEHAGLGLSIAKHIMKAHGQKLEAESRLGVGSKFTFWLQMDASRQTG
jgi:signal transduction histidine kinase